MASWSVHTEPFPHFIIDGVVPQKAVLQMFQNWPGEGNFKAEVPGNYVCDLSPFVNEGYWQTIHESVRTIVANALLAFKPWIKKRYPEEDQFNIVFYSLMQADGNYGGHTVHTHHYHDPLWVMTMLMYLDQDAEGHHGTTLLAPKKDLDPAYVAAQTLHWRDLTEEHSTVEYQSGRMLAFFDNPLAFHSVKPSNGRFGRRILRLHIGVPNDRCESLYGVSLEEYRQLRMAPTNDERVLGWMRRDIEQLKI